MGSATVLEEPDAVDQEEYALLVRCRARDAQAFAAIVERYHERAFWVAYQLIGDVHEARDLVQEAFLRVFRAIDSFELGKNFFTWMYRIVSNLAIDHLRRSSHRSAVSLDSQLEIAGPQTGPVVKLAAEELSQAVRTVLDLLPPRYRDVLVMRDLLDLTCKEIGLITGTKHATVRWQLHQARKLFRDAWDGEDATIQEHDDDAL
jgi:RNA polymerase sigma-70 factor (ECF subfamily)